MGVVWGPRNALGDLEGSEGQSSQESLGAGKPLRGAVCSPNAPGQRVLGPGQGCLALPASRTRRKPSSLPSSAPTFLPTGVSRPLSVPLALFVPVGPVSGGASAQVSLDEPPLSPGPGRPGSRAAGTVRGRGDGGGPDCSASALSPSAGNAIQAFGNGTEVNLSPKNPSFQATQAPRVEKTPPLPDDLSDSTNLGTSVITTCTSVEVRGLALQLGTGAGQTEGPERRPDVRGG